MVVMHLPPPYLLHLWWNCQICPLFVGIILRPCLVVDGGFEVVEREERENSAHKQTICVCERVGTFFGGEVDEWEKEGRTYVCKCNYNLYDLSNVLFFLMNNELMTTFALEFYFKILLWKLLRANSWVWVWLEFWVFFYVLFLYDTNVILKDFVHLRTFPIY